MIPRIHRCYQRRPLHFLGSTDRHTKSDGESAGRAVGVSFRAEVMLGTVVQVAAPV